MLVPLAIPPGLFRNGTEYGSKARWRDASLVRWVEGIMRPIGGWETRVSVGASIPSRAALAWSDLSGTSRIALGQHSKLYAVLAAGTVTDITPVGLTAGNLDAVIKVGYGNSTFGTGYYGTPRPDVGTYSEATTWALDTFGQELLACSVSDGRIFKWDLNVINDGVALAGAPVNNVSMMVTDERFVFALGAAGNRRKVQWSDRENATSWTPAATNQAGDQDLQTSGQIMCGIRVRGQALILTDIDAHAATYIGPPFVYGFERVGSSCGPVSRKALASVDAGAFWMGQRGFFVYSGGAVTEIPCDVADYVFPGLSIAQASKTYAVANAQFSEIWWFYTSSGSNENDRYVTYNYKDNIWSFGNLARSCGVDRGVFRTPIWFGTTGQGYNHETGLNFDGMPVFCESGPIELGNGDNVMQVNSLIPDELTQGDVTATFKAKYYPNDTERTYGPYSTRNPTSVRFTGRQFKLRVDGARLADFRVGTLRVEVKIGGLR